MKTTTLLVAALCAAFASAGVIRTPIRPIHVVPKIPGDCFFGVVTPTGCGPLRSE